MNEPADEQPDPRTITGHPSNPTVTYVFLAAIAAWIAACWMMLNAISGQLGIIIAQLAAR